MPAVTALGQKCTSNQSLVAGPVCVPSVVGRTVVFVCGFTVAVWPLLVFLPDSDDHRFAVVAVTLQIRIEIEHGVELFLNLVDPLRDQLTRRKRTVLVGVVAGAVALAFGPCHLSVLVEFGQRLPYRAGVQSGSRCDLLARTLGCLAEVDVDAGPCFRVENPRQQVDDVLVELLACPVCLLFESSTHVGGPRLDSETTRVCVFIVVLGGIVGRHCSTGAT